MQVLTASEMQQTDRRTAADFDIPTLTLMHAAGEAVARFALARYPAANILVLCGKGNNGGDGFVAARHLLAAGRQVRVLLLGNPASLKGDAATVFNELRPLLPPENLLLAEEETTPDRTLAQAPITAALDQADLLLDAVLGTGFKPPLRGLPAALRDRIAKLSAPILSVDLPTGWDADYSHSDGKPNPEAFPSSAVVTFTAPKPAHVFGNLTRGPIVVAPIGSPDAAIQSTQQLHWAGSSASLTHKLREVNANKGKYGHVLVIGGSGGASQKAGAPSMSSLAALRSGAGLVTVLVPESIAAIVSSYAPELMVATTATDDAKTPPATHFTPKHLRPEFLGPLLEKISVLAVGPGLSLHPEAAAFARGLLAATSLPAVFDADALNAFAGRADLLTGNTASGKRTLVITPHPGEMARLANCTIPQVESDRVQLARAFATEHSLTLVLKGWRTLIAHPDGRIAINTTGNPALAKGGSGDLLTGIIAAMLAQYVHPDTKHPGSEAQQAPKVAEADAVAEAVEAAVFLHGLAADYALQSQDQHTVLATDLLAHLYQAFRHRNPDQNHQTWLTNLPESNY